MRLRSGAPFVLDTIEGRRTLSGTVALKTRRPRGPLPPTAPRSPSTWAVRCASGPVLPTWTERPGAYTVEVSADGRAWHAPDGTPAWYVRGTVWGAGAALAGLDVRS